jgi:hypothetical protein
VSASERTARVATWLVIGLLAGGCQTGRDLWPVERLDPRSAVNTTIMAEPWVYARDVPAIAANSRDYLNIGLIETNRAGQRAYWLGVVAWSTIDRSALSAPVAPVRPSAIQLGWGESSLELQPAKGGREMVGASEPIFAGPQPTFEDAWYMLTRDQLLRLAQAPPATISLEMPEGAPLVYETWRVDPRALEQFLEATGHPERRR